jgi:hypothetical protein
MIALVKFLMDKIFLIGGQISGMLGAFRGPLFVSILPCLKRVSTFKCRLMDFRDRTDLACLCRKEARKKHYYTILVQIKCDWRWKVYSV